MKIIRKHQVGGSVYTPLVYQPQSDIDSTRTSSKRGSGRSSGGEDEGGQLTKISGTMTKEIVDILKTNGIPTDVDTFLSHANQFLAGSTSLSDQVFGGNKKDYDISHLIKIHSIANQVKFNKQLYDKASGRLTSENAWSEVAVNNRGQMYVYGENGIDLISATEYHKNRDKYTALTNSELLSLRESDPSLALNEGILNSINNTVGLESVVKYVKDIIKGFGNKVQEGYTSKDQNMMEEGFRNLLMGGPDGYYKVTSEDQGTKFALDYIVDALPSNMKQLLRAKTAAEGGDPNSQDINRLLALALSEHRNLKRSAQFDKGASSFEYELAKDVAKEKKDKMVMRSREEAIVAGDILTEADIREFKLAPQGKGNPITLYTLQFGSPQTKSGESIDRTTLENLLNRDPLGQSLDKTSISFGTQHIGANDLKEILWDGVSQWNRVELPWYVDEKGAVIPNLRIQDKLDALNEKINSSAYVAPAEINNWILQSGLDVIYDPNSRMVRFRETRPFMMLNGMGSSGTIDNFDKDDPFISKVEEGDRRALSKLYDAYRNYDTPYTQKNKKPGDYDTSTRWNMYNAPIFIPITHQSIATATRNNERVPESDYVNIRNQYNLQRQKERIITTPD